MVDGPRAASSPVSPTETSMSVSGRTTRAPSMGEIGAPTMSALGSGAWREVIGKGPSLMRTAWVTWPPRRVSSSKSGWGTRAAPGLQNSTRRTAASVRHDRNAIEQLCARPGRSRFPGSGRVMLGEDKWPPEPWHCSRIRGLRCVNAGRAGRTYRAAKEGISQARCYYRKLVYEHGIPVVSGRCHTGFCVVKRSLVIGTARYFPLPRNRWQMPSEGCPLLVVTSAERPEPDCQLAPGCRISVAIAQDGTQRGQFTHLTKDWIPIPRPDVAAIGGDEGVALRFWQSEPRRLEGRNQVDFPVASADRVPIGQHDPRAIAEQVSPPGVTVDHPGGKLKAELAVRGLELLAAGPQPATFFLVDHSARVNGPAYGNKRLVGRQRNQGREVGLAIADSSAADR